MSAAIRTVVLSKGEATYDSDMPMSTFRKLLGASAEGSLDGIIESMAEMVQTWPFEGDPSDEGAWDALRRTEFNELVTKVTEDLGALGEE